ncbi:hypothetical protein LTR37_013910 [Vermiconidia calcicola]|uniref:Uncharacterized protein n=1 Tax=Vermiconidia calcicola TaxID=1690605 RepID=A0ACC3MWM2_9PEZI|nr:hypothetical protein LTR37_013910 [Vermiconidia calcicola]
MDRFYLQNADLYRSLIDSVDSTVPAPHFSRHKAPPPNETVVKEQYNPDMVVAARIRPMLDEDVTVGFPRAVYPRARRTDEPQVVDLQDLYNHPRGRPVLRSSNYQLDMLFDSDATSTEIYANLVLDLISFAQQGGVGTLFAYGQTGSGKTFTVSQLQKLAALSLMDEDLLEQREIYITIVDIAANSAFDLLDSRKPIAVLEDSSGNTQLAGAKEHRVSAKDELLDLIAQAAVYRRTAPTMKNDASSRSHSICRISIRNTSSSSGNDGILYLVDLAGSEAARDVVQHGADRMRETREINMSLSVLKDCVQGKAESETFKLKGLRSKQKKVHVPIRQSTLTKVLKHVFDPTGGRACKTVVVACVNPSLADVAQSKNTLRYAEMLRAPIPTANR